METNTTMDTVLNPEIKIPSEQIEISFTESNLGLGYGSINAPEVTQEEASKRAENMRDFFVEVMPDAPSDCIDGRRSLTLSDGSKVESARPGVAGGAGVTGYAAAELTSYFGESVNDVHDKFEKIVDRLEADYGGSQVIVAGGHVDADAVANEFSEGKTGCGAADKFIANLALLSRLNATYEDLDGNEKTETDEEVQQRLDAVRALTRAVSEQSAYYEFEGIDQSIDSIINNATDLIESSSLGHWSGSIMKESLTKKGEDRLVVLDTSAGGVHGHTERKALFSYIENATFDQDKYYDHTKETESEGREIFDIDVWHIRDIANKLANSPDETQASNIFTAGVAFQIATYLGLCDGSHRAFFAKHA